MLPDNGEEFTDRLFGAKARPPSGEHELDRLCQALGIEHRLTRPKSPQTNGMVGRFNGRLAQVPGSHHFVSGEQLQKTLLRYVWLYNEHLPQKSLSHRTPMQAMKQWHQNQPNPFIKKPVNHPGYDS